MKPMILLAAGAALAAAGVEAQPAGPGSLEGLWVAKERYGPEISGTLLILPRGEGLVADIAGFQVPVRQAGEALSFELPGGSGSFRGHRAGREIVGQLVQARTIEAGAAFATPVVLRGDGRGRWRGEVRPLADEMTYYLPVTRGADGRFVTYLRNPERNQGLFLGASRIEQEGDLVRLVGTRRGGSEENVIAAGRRDAESGRFSLPLRGTAFDFARETNSASAFYPRGNPGARYRYAPPVQLGDGWPVSTLEREGIDRAAIERFVQKLIDMPMDGVSSSQIHSVLIVRNGRLVLEEYFHGHDRDTPHDTRSASKSWTNVLIGAAIEAGVPIGLDTPSTRQCSARCRPTSIRASGR